MTISPSTVSYTHLDVYKRQNRTLGRDDGHRPERSLVRRNFHIRRHDVEQQRADGAEAGDLGRTFERHIERRLDLFGRAGEIDFDAVALDPDAYLDGQANVAVSAVIVEEALGPVFTVRNG